MPLTLPNGLSLARLVLAPTLLPLALAGWRGLFWGILLTALATDYLDGRVARATGRETLVGARLDSMADCVLFCLAPIAAVILYPSLWQQHQAAMIAVAVGYLGPITLGWIKFGQLTSYHTLAARVVSVLLPAGFILYVMTASGWLLDLAAVVLLLSAVEEVWLTLVLPHWTANVPSLWHLQRPGAFSPRHSDDGSLA